MSISKFANISAAQALQATQNFSNILSLFPIGALNWNKIPQAGKQPGGRNVQWHHIQQS